jgi:tripartite ATP-independent transporter DctP family solute receptor
MVRKSLKVFLIFTVIALMFASAALAGKLNPTKENPVTLRLAYLDNPTWPDTSNIPEPEHAYAVVFKAFVESATNGAVKVELFPAGQLGGSRELTEMVKTGALDLAIETGNMGSFYPEYQLINIPYVFISDEVAWWLFDNHPFWKKLMADMEKKTGLMCLGMGQNGVRNFTNNVRPIREPKDMKGIKFRVMQSPVFVKTVEALGAKAIPIAWPEVYTSLQTGVIDGQENPIATIYYVGKLHEVQKYLTLGRPYLV